MLYITVKTITEKQKTDRYWSSSSIWYWNSNNSDLVYFFIRSSGNGPGPGPGNYPDGTYFYGGKCIPNCKNGLLSCGTGCYDPNTHECLIGNIICSK